MGYRVNFLTEMGNAVNNIRLASNPSITDEKRKEYYNQAARSVMIATGLIAENISQYTALDDKTNAIRGRAIGALNTTQIMTRLVDNFNGLIKDHKDGVVDLGKMQSIMADTFSLASFAMQKNNPVAAQLLDRTAASITLISLTYPGGQMSTEDFYNLDNWMGFTKEQLGVGLEKLSRQIYEIFPDRLNPWKQRSFNTYPDNNINDFVSINIDGGEKNAVVADSNMSLSKDLVHSLFAAYTSGDKNALSSVVTNHVYTQQRSQEVSEQVQQLKEAEQQRMAEQLVEVQQVEQQRHRMVRS